MSEKSIKIKIETFVLRLEVIDALGKMVWTETRIQQVKR